MCGQATLLREVLARDAGNEIVLTVALALWLLGSAVGGMLWPRLVGIKSVRVPSLLVLGGVVSLAATPSARFIPLLGSVAGESARPMAVFLLCTVVLLPTSILTAGLFGVAAAGRPPGRAYFAEAIGAVCAGIATTILLLLRIDPLTILSMALVVAILLVAPRRAGLIVATGLIAVVLLGGTARLDRASFIRAWEIHHPGLSVLDHAFTPTRTLVLAEREGERWLFADGIPREVLGDRYGAEQTAAAILVAAPQVRSVALVDFGSAGVAEALRDAGVARVACLFPEQEDTVLVPIPAGVECLIGDPRRTLRRLEGEWDGIVLSSGVVTSLGANRLWTAEAFEAMARKLSPGGVVLTLTPGGAAAVLPETRAWRSSVAAAMLEAIGPTAAIDADRFLIAASRTPGTASWDPDTIATRWSRGRFDLPSYSTERLAVEFPPGRRVELPEAPANRDARPAAIGSALSRWARESGLRGGVPDWIIWLLVAGLVLAPLFPRRDTAVLLATGGASMGLDLIILLAYQCRVGILQAGLGILLAGFLGGSAVGAYLAEKRGWGERSLLPICLSQACAALAIGIVAPSLPGGMAAIGTIVFALLAFGAGIFCGLPFPIVAARRGSGHAWAADALGGIVGATLVLLLATRGMAIVGAAMAVLPLLASSRLLGSRRRSSRTALPLAR